MGSFYQVSSSLFLLLVAVLQPAEVYQEIPIRVGRPLLITINPQSPSMAAFRDSLMELKNKKESLIESETVQLQAGHSYFGLPIIHQGQIRRKLDGLTVRAHISLDGMEINKPLSGMEIHTKQINKKNVQLANYSSQTKNKVVGTSIPKPKAKDFFLYELSGSLEMIGGLLFTGVDTHLSISRVVHGQVMDRGDISIQDGIYKLFASDLRGHIVVRLYNVHGKILGLGEFDLYQLPDRAKELSQIDKLHITVKPYKSKLIAELVSGESFGDQIIPVEGRFIVNSAQVEAKKGTTFSDDSFLPHSSFIVHAEKEGHWPSLAVGVNGQGGGAMRIYSDSMVKALLDIQGRKGPVIWGRVTKNGQPVHGAKVELAGEEVPPVYFNSYIPDSQLNATKTDGLFAFVGVSPGLQSVRATMQGEYISTQIIPTQQNHVSYLDVKMGNRRSAGVSIYDAQTHKPLWADLHIYGTDESIRINEDEAIHFPGGPGVMMIEAESGGDYLYSRYSVARSQKSIHVPMVRADWWDGMKKHVQQDLNRGVLVGYVSDKLGESEFHYETFIDIEYDKNNIVYFKDQEFLETGISGGGFILFNIPQGMHTVTVAPVGGDMVFTQISIVGTDAINVMPVSL